MDEKSLGLQSIDYRQVFPWIHLFRAFRIAVDIRKMILAGLALVVLAMGNWAFTELPFAPSEKEAQRVDWPWHESPERPAHRKTTRVMHTVTKLFFIRPTALLGYVAEEGIIPVRPWESVVEPAGVLLLAGNTWSAVAFAWTQLLWTFIVWSVFGGAITRMAAVQFARDERISMRDALSYSGGRFLSYFSAPLLPIAGFGFFWALCVVGGLIGRIPGAGDIIIGALWIVPLVLGFLMALILIGVAVGWPLMLTTISVEGSDAFDGFSRAYSYVYNRPWHLLWYVIVAMVYGSAVIFFVSFMTWLIVYLAGWSVAAGMGSQNANALFQGAPELLGGSSLLIETEAARFRTWMEIGDKLVGIWLHVVALLLIGFVYSYFWTASTIIYLLLRRGDDGTDLDAVYLPEEQERDELLPLVGVAASDQPVIERPATGDVTTTQQAEAHNGDTETDISSNNLSDDGPKD